MLFLGFLIWLLFFSDFLQVFSCDLFSGLLMSCYFPCFSGFLNMIKVFKDFNEVLDMSNPGWVGSWISKTLMYPLSSLFEMNIWMKGLSSNWRYLKEMMKCMMTSSKQWKKTRDLNETAMIFGSVKQGSLNDLFANVWWFRGISLIILLMVQKSHSQPPGMVRVLAGFRTNHQPWSMKFGVIIFHDPCNFYLITRLLLRFPQLYGWHACDVCPWVYMDLQAQLLCWRWMH